MYVFFQAEDGIRDIGVTGVQTCALPILLICLFVFWRPDSLARVTAFAVLGIYVAFQAVVLAALRQRLKGWHPAGRWNLGRWGTAGERVGLPLRRFADRPRPPPARAGEVLRPLVLVLRPF